MDVWRVGAGLARAGDIVDAAGAGGSFGVGVKFEVCDGAWFSGFVERFPNMVERFVAAPGVF